MRVRGEERVTRTTGNKGHSSLLKHLDSVVAVIISDERLHRGGGEYLGMNSFVLYELTEGQRVDHCRKHSHPVASDTVETLVEALETTENVAPAIHDTDLETGLGSLGYLTCIFPEILRLQSPSTGISVSLSASAIS